MYWVCIIKKKINKHMHALLSLINTVNTTIKLSKSCITLRDHTFSLTFSHFSLFQPSLSFDCDVKLQINNQVTHICQCLSFGFLG